jgi:hypothetical protein
VHKSVVGYLNPEARGPLAKYFFACLHFAVSGCRFWLPLLLPLLVAVLHGQIPGDSLLPDQSDLKN